MFWYVVILILLIGPMGFAYIGYLKGFNTRKIVMLLSFLMLLIFMAFRADSVGADTKQYCWFFEQFQYINMFDVFNAPISGYGGGYEVDLEYGYRLYNGLLSVLSNDPQFITIINSVLILGLLYLFIKRNSEYPFLSIWLYITLGIFQTQMNMGRNAIAILICYLAFDFIKEKKLIPYIGYILIAISFHASSVLFLPLYWIVRKIPLTPRIFKSIFLFAVIIGLSFPLFRSSVVAVIPEIYQDYALGNMTKYESLLVGLFHFFLVGIIYLFTNPKLRGQLAKLVPIGTWMFIFDIFFYCVGLDWSIAARLAGLFGPFLIVYIPNLISKGINTKTKRIIMITLLIVICGVEYIIRLNLNNIGATMPYEFYFL